MQDIPDEILQRQKAKLTASAQSDLSMAPALYSDRSSSEPPQAGLDLSESTAVSPPPTESAHKNALPFDTLGLADNDGVIELYADRKVLTKALRRSLATMAITLVVACCLLPIALRDFVLISTEISVWVLFVVYACYAVYSRSKVRIEVPVLKMAPDGLYLNDDFTVMPRINWSEVDSIVPVKNGNINLTFRDRDKIASRASGRVSYLIWQSEAISRVFPQYRRHRHDYVVPANISALSGKSLQDYLEGYKALFGKHVEEPDSKTKLKTPLYVKVLLILAAWGWLSMALNVTGLPSMVNKQITLNCESADTIMRVGERRKRLAGALARIEYPYGLLLPAENPDFVTAVGDRQAQDYKKEVSSLERVLTKNGNDVDALFMIGQAYNKLGQSQLALQHLTLANSLKPDDPDILSMRALAELKMRNYKAAFDDCTNALSFDAYNFNALIVRGITNTHLKNYKQADYDFETAMKWTRNFEPYYYRSISKIRQGESEEALHDLNEAIRLSPETSTLLLARANVYDKLGVKNMAALDRTNATAMGLKSTNADQKDGVRIQTSTQASSNAHSATFEPIED